MNKSTIFTQAHKLAKAGHVAGECYRVTFAAALRIVIAESKAPKTIIAILKDAGMVSSTNEYKGRTYINLHGQSYGDSQATKIWVNKAGDEITLELRKGKESDRGLNVRVAMAELLSKTLRKTNPERGVYCWA